MTHCLACNTLTGITLLRPGVTPLHPPPPDCGHHVPALVISSTEATAASLAALGLYPSRDRAQELSKFNEPSCDEVAGMAPSHKTSWSFDRTRSPPTSSPRSSPGASPAPSASPSDSPAAPSRPAPTLSVSEYHAEHRRRHGPRPMSAEGSETPRAPRAADLLFEGIEEGEVDYDTDTPMPQQDESPRSAEPQLPPLRAPNPFPERRASPPMTALRASSGLETPVVTNDLNEVQELQLHAADTQRSLRPEARPLLSSRREYGFDPRPPEQVIKQLTSQELRLWVAGPEASTPADIATRETHRVRF